jgi:glycerol-3-phosphate dehydrogenase
MHQSAPQSPDPGDIHDILIIGGGINGCGIARDAAGRGLKVWLCEMNDLASGTSSWSTKLIHGGLRYLEYYEFRLVREALMEREVIWSIAPHIVAPLRFVLPHHKGLRPAWLLRLGLFLYDYIGGRKLLPATRTLDLRSDPAGLPLKPGLFLKGFEYSDCSVDDARLVVLNARDAAERGARIHTRTRAVSAERGTDAWTVTAVNAATGATQVVRGRVLVNAAGPWVAQVLSGAMRSNAKAKVRLVQGSHIVVRKLYDHDRSYIFQNADGRIIFAIPYEDDFTLIGTTDQDYQGDPAAVAITPEEITYLCDAAGEYFQRPIREEDVVWTFSGVRPLYDDGASEAKAATRDYVFDTDETPGLAPQLSIFGGKITTYRRLAEAVLDKLGPHLGAAASARKGWTGREPLPGGDFPPDGRSRLAAALKAEHLFLTDADAARLARAYGTRARVFLKDSRKASDLGRWFGPLSEAEINHLKAEEWAITSQDILWRRSKLGLRLTADEQAELARYLGEG